MWKRLYLNANGREMGLCLVGLLGFKMCGLRQGPQCSVKMPNTNRLRFCSTSSGQDAERDEIRFRLWKCKTDG